MHRLGNVFVLDSRPYRTPYAEMDANYDHEGKFFTTVDGVPVRKLFVGNLPELTPYDLTSTQGIMFRIFQNYGSLKDIKIINKCPKPFAFVTFVTPQAAARAYNKKGTFFLHQKKLYLSFADSWHQPLDLPNGEVCWDRRDMAEEQAQEAEQSDNDSEGHEAVDGAENERSNDDDEGKALLQGECTEEEVLMEDCPIDRLNDDCLQLIFDWLSLPERLTLGRVCRRWRNMNSYYWSSFKALDFTCPPFDQVILTDAKLSYFLHNCPNLTSLNISQDDHDLTSNAVVTIGKICKDLEEIHMRNIIVKKRSLAYLANTCSKLTSFSMDACTSLHDGEMISLVKKSKNLEKIKLRYGTKTTGMWLKYIQHPLRSLKLEMYEFNSDYLLEGIAKAKTSLKELSFVSCTKVRNQDLAKIVSLVPKMTHFTLSGMIQLYDTKALEPITLLSELEYLDLDHNRFVNDKFVAALVEGCPKLRHLNLSGIETTDLTERGLTRLVDLKELTHLRMACLKVTNHLLKVLSKKLKLKHLDIMGCSLVTDEGCIEILNNCHHLESLDLAACSEVTNETILAAVNILSNETKRKKLHIVAGSTKVKALPWFYESDLKKRLSVDLKTTFFSNEFDEIYRMDDSDDLDGSEGSFDDYDLYAEYEDYHNYFGSDSENDPEYDLFDIIHNNFEFYVEHVYDDDEYDD